MPLVKVQPRKSKVSLLPIQRSVRFSSAQRAISFIRVFSTFIHDA